MTRKSLPVVSLILILVIVLGTAGVAYGLWSETLKIKGVVLTGEVDVGFSGPYVKEWVEVNGKHMREPEVKDKYAECYAWAFDTDPSTGKEKIVVAVLGAYPSYHCMVKFDVSNLGTVPVHISLPEGNSPEWVNVSACYPNWDQVHPGESRWAKILIHFTNNDGVQELTPYFFNFTIDALQWNEAPPTDLGGSGDCNLAEIEGEFEDGAEIPAEALELLD